MSATPRDYSFHALRNHGFPVRALDRMSPRSRSVLRALIEDKSATPLDMINVVLEMTGGTIEPSQPLKPSREAAFLIQNGMSIATVADLTAEERTEWVQAFQEPPPAAAAAPQIAKERFPFRRVYADGSRHVLKRPGGRSVNAVYQAKAPRPWVLEHTDEAYATVVLETSGWTYDRPTA